MGATLARVLDLVPEVARRSDDVEREQRVPADLFDQLVRAGCHRMLVPTTYGGDEVDLPEMLRVIEALARADGSVGWSVAQSALAQAVAVCFPATAMDGLFAAGPDLLGAVTFAPKGRAVRQEGGWRVLGQWPFATGCDRAAWFFVHCLVVEDRKVQLLANGLPVTRVALLPASAVEILDTWRAVGLRGTASHDIRVREEFCPEEHSCTLLGAVPTVSRAVFRVPLMERGCLLLAAVAVGIAQGALDELTALAAGGRRLTFSRERLAQCPIFQDRLGEAHMTLQAARALLYSQAETSWAAAATGQGLMLIQRAGLLATPAQVTALATRVTDSAYTVAGGSAVYDTSPLQRRLRDVHTATQHTWNGRGNTKILGALIAGEEVDTMLF